jgi:hypothetical protein
MCSYHDTRSDGCCDVSCMHNTAATNCMLSDPLGSSNLRCLHLECLYSTGAGNPLDDSSECRVET